MKNKKGKKVNKTKKNKKVNKKKLIIIISVVLVVLIGVVSGGYYFYWVPKTNAETLETMIANVSFGDIEKSIDSYFVDKEVRNIEKDNKEQQDLYVQYEQNRPQIEAIITFYDENDTRSVLLDSKVETIKEFDEVYSSYFNFYYVEFGQIHHDVFFNIDNYMGSLGNLNDFELQSAKNKYNELIPKMDDIGQTDAQKEFVGLYKSHMELFFVEIEAYKQAEAAGEIHYTYEYMFNSWYKMPIDKYRIAMLSTTDRMEDSAEEILEAQSLIHQEYKASLNALLNKL